MAVLGALSAMVEFLFQTLERWFVHKRTNRKFLQRTYRELTILGVMSFVLIVVRDYSATLTKNQFQIIEFAHLWIFSVGISFIVTGVTVATLLRQTKAGWDDAFAFGLQKIELDFLKIRGSRKGIRKIWHLLLPFYVSEEGELMQKARLWVLRKGFLERNGLPIAFEFAKFLRRSLTRIVLGNMQIGWQSWLALGFIFVTGFVVARIADDFDETVRLTSALRVLLGISGVFVLLSAFLYGLIELGVRQYLRISGATQPRDFECLMELAKEIYFEEGNIIMDPTGKLTSDEVRLDMILQEHRARDRLSDREFTVRHRLFDMINVKMYTEQGISSITYGNTFVGIFRVILLGQSYVFGLFVIVLSQFSSSSFDGIAVLFMFATMALHLILVWFFFPRILRDYALLSSVARVDEAALDGIEDVLLYQQDVNESIFVLSKILHLQYKERIRRDLDEDAPVALYTVYSMLDVEGKGSVNSTKMQKRLERHPFRKHMKKQRIHMVFRALNCQGGFRYETCEFLVLGMHRLERREKRESLRLQACFEGITVACKKCGRTVPAMETWAHVENCKGQGIAGDRASVMSNSSFDGIGKERDGERNGNRDGDLSVGVEATFQGNRASVLRDAHFGLMRPFAFHQEHEL